MALPVNDIIAQLQRGNQGDEGDGEAEDGGEEGEEVVAGEDEGDGRKYIEDVELEIIDGNKHGKWLVINQVHIAFKSKEYMNNVYGRNASPTIFSGST